MSLSSLRIHPKPPTPMAKSPCKNCPYRKDSLPGWLGSAETPAEFLKQLELPYPHPCHPKVDWEKTKQEDLPEFGLTHPCIGELVFMRNTCKSPRDPDFRELVNEYPPDREQVFANKQEFINHHSNRTKI